MYVGKKATKNDKIIIKDNDRNINKEN